MQGSHQPTKRPHELNPGEWTWHEGVLYARCPDGALANLHNHTVSGPQAAITVAPSILCHDWRQAKPWHGYLTDGVWREC
jgi:hypothetical protein